MKFVFLKNKVKIKVIYKIVCFWLIGVSIFVLFEKMFLYKYYWPADAAYATKTIEGMYREKENIDVLAVGTSHMMDAFIPLELYEDYGIISYNAATTSQPIKISYFLLKEAAKNNEIKIFIYDIGSLMSQQGWWGPVMDSAPLNLNKIEIALDIAKKDNEVTFGEVILPIARQHERWKTLSKTDFEIYRQKPLYSKGYNLYTEMSWAKYSVEEMNNIAASLRENEFFGCEYSNGVYSLTEGKNTEPISVSEDDLKWLIKMRDFCKEREIEFICTKIPSVYQPELYRSAWTLEKNDLAKNICSENQITYCDMLYEGETRINYETDFVDGGIHLNYLGGRKATDYLGRYLVENYTLPKRTNAQWDSDLELYQEVRQLALLQLDFDFTSYMNRIANEFQDQVILIAVSHDMAAGLSQEDIQLLQRMGLQTDFRDKINDSYVAVIEHGAVKYENLSNRKINYSGTSGNIPFYLESAGYFSGAKASIIVNGIEYAVNGRGINIVVYDDEKNMLYDSVRFDTNSEIHYAERTARRTECVRNLETFLMEKN